MDNKSLHPLLQKKKDTLSNTIDTAEEVAEELAIVVESSKESLSLSLIDEEFDKDPVIAFHQKERQAVIKEMQGKRQDASYSQLAQALSQLNKDISALQNPQNAQNDGASQVVAISINFPDGSARLITTHSQAKNEEESVGVIDI